MCGIVYKSNFYKSTRIIDFVKACETINHRGPDEFGYLLNDNHSFGHKRLAVIDIKNGKQPMSILNNHLIYNGELYNTDELKKILYDKNVSLENHSDTLLLLKLLMNYDDEILNKLNGIFSFVYVRDDEVLAARDMFGVKPLYYSIIDNDIFIASEIKAILEYKKEAIVTLEGLNELLGMGPSHSQGKTIYKDIYELKPGYCLRFNKTDGLILKQYYKLNAYPYELSYKDTVKKVKELLDKAIKRQMVSDVGVSTFLSGGLDSSIISSVVAKNVSSLDTYSIEYEDNDFKSNDYEVTEDKYYASLVSEKIESNHHNVVIPTEMVARYLKRGVEMKDSPGMTDIDSSMIFLGEDIALKHKVSLSGEAADEIFAGYPWYYKKDNTELFPWIRNIEFREDILNDNYKGRLKLKEYVKNEYDMAISEAPILDENNKLDTKHKRLSYLNIKYFMTNLLDRKDRMTMASSLEVRVPFCDKELVELLYNVPFKYKYRYKTEKKLLRDAYKDEVIKEVINRKKSPYPKSNSNKYDKIVRSLLLDCLKDNDGILHKLFDVNKIIDLINSKDELDEPWYGQLMRKTSFLAYLYQIDYWYKKYNIRIEE